MTSNTQTEFLAAHEMPPVELLRCSVSGRGIAELRFCTGREIDDIEICLACQAFLSNWSLKALESGDGRGVAVFVGGTATPLSRTMEGQGGIVTLTGVTDVRVQ